MLSIRCRTTSHDVSPFTVGSLTMPSYTKAQLARLSKRKVSAKVAKQMGDS